MCAEHSGQPGPVFPRLRGDVQHSAQCSEEEETEVLDLLIFLSAFVYCLTPCQNNVYLANLKRK